MTKWLAHIKQLFSLNGKSKTFAAVGFHSAEKIKKSLAYAKGIVYEIDNDYTIKWVSRETAEKYPGVIGGKCYEAFAGNSEPCNDCYCKKVFATGEFQTSLKHLNYAKTNGGGYWKGISMPIFDNQQNIKGVLLYSQKIDDPDTHRHALLNANLPVIADKELDTFIKDNYRIVFDSIHLPLCITGNNLKIVFHNESFAKIIGRGNRDLIGEEITELIPEIREIGTKKILSLIVAGTEQQSYSFELKRNFNQNNVTLKISPIKLSNAKIGGIIWRINVNPKTKAKNDDFRINNRFQKNFGLMILDDRGFVIQWNDFLEKTFLWSEEELIGLPNPIINIETIKEHIENHSSEKLELTRKNKSGQKVDIKITVFPVINEEGVTTQYVCLIENTTYEKYIKSEFKELEERYNNFIKNFEGITFKFDTDFNLLQLKGSVLPLTGYTEDEFLNGKITFKDLVYSDDRILIDSYINKIKKHLRTEKELELRIVAKDKSIKWLHIYFQNTADEFGNITQVQGFMYNITQRKEVEKELELRREEYRTLAMYLETAREEEKKRLALEIHDEIGHALTAIKLELAWVLRKKFLRRDVMEERFRHIYELIESTIRKVRTISSDLRPSVLDHFGLEAALEWQASEFQKRSALRCKIKLDKQQINIDERTSTTIFRIFQEILTNIAKHAKASRVDVILEKYTNKIVLKVSDNGKGFKPEKTKKSQGLGILGMKERANAVGGELSINSVVGVGTTVMLTVPITIKKGKEND